MMHRVTLLVTGLISLPLSVLIGGKLGLVLFLFNGCVFIIGVLQIEYD